MSLQCPTCNAAVAPEDVNVAKDVFYCRKCNSAFALSEIVEPEPPLDVDLASPPRGVWFEQTFDGFVLGATTRNAFAFFLVPFMCVWSGFSLGGIYGSQIMSGKFNLFMSIVLEGKERIAFGSMLSDNRRYFMLHVLRKMLQH